MITAGRALLTLLSLVVPDALLMRAMGWTGVAEVVLVAASAFVATALLVLSTPRHRRNEWRLVIGLGTLIVWVALAATIFGTSWNARVVIAALLIVPGLSYLLLEALGLTPTPATLEPLS